MNFYEILSASWDGTIRVWYGESYEQSIVLEAKNTLGKVKNKNDEFHVDARVDDVHSAYFSPDGSQIVSAHQDGTVRVWHGKEFQECIVRKRRGVIVPVRHAKFSPDGSQIVSCQGKELVLWYGEAFQEHTVLGCHEKVDRFGNAVNLSGANFSPNGSQIVSGAYGDSDIIVWNVENYRAVAYLDHQKQNFFREGSVYRPSFSPDGLRILGAYLDHFVRVWHGDRFQEYKEFSSGLHIGGDPESAIFSPNGSQILIVYGKQIDICPILDNDSEKCITLEHHAFGQSHAAFSPDGSQIVFSALTDLQVLYGEKFQQATVLKGTVGGVITSVDFA